MEMASAIQVANLRKLYEQHGIPWTDEDEQLARALPKDAVGTARSTIRCWVETRTAYGTYCAVDVETANESRHICSVGIVRFVSGAAADVYEQKIKPQTAISKRHQRIHGIGNGDVEGAPTLRDAMEDISAFLGDAPVVAHTAFDRTAFNRSGEHIANGWLDSCQIARRSYPDLPNHKLPTVARHLGVDLAHHDALSDARASGEILASALRLRISPLAAHAAGGVPRLTPQQHAALPESKGSKGKSAAASYRRPKNAYSIIIENGDEDEDEDSLIIESDTFAALEERAERGRAAMRWIYGGAAAALVLFALALLA